jgi:hypothetical protein
MTVVGQVDYGTTHKRRPRTFPRAAALRQKRPSGVQNLTSALHPKAASTQKLGHVRKSADIVAKVENRATRKISRKLIFGLLRRCVAFQRHYGDPWSILDETIWSLTSPLVKRISGSKKFRSSPQKDFCNNIPSRTDIVSRACQVRKVPEADSPGFDKKRPTDPRKSA